ncbi:hypothetical protein SUGI_0996120 [Cryptomeria japonica]|uniref:uncharacterized protein LOC131072554 n=1 Tax=Cryptomeria japonica TaxID=3369 RepID=UPI002414C0A1|nr:uncharacterized protein LOC131072554 [Cryptomeria japonica]GLJ47187.1 hypothetical protein SUGI_0996120 [Cryptomeria japonica]
MSRKRAAFEPVVPCNMDAKHANLMQDYLQLQDEFVAMKDQVNKSKMRKATLLAEVRFLRRRLKKLKEAPPNLRENGTVSSSPPSTSYSGKPTSRAIAPEPSTVPRKNNLLASSKIPAIREPIRTSASEYPTERKVVNHNVGLVSALKTSVFRTKPSEFVTAMSEKRKISWQDQISLECK